MTCQASNVVYGLARCRSLRIAAASICVLLAVFWIASLFFEFYYFGPSSTVQIGGGAVSFGAGQRFAMCDGWWFNRRYYWDEEVVWSGDFISNGYLWATVPLWVPFILVLAVSLTLQLLNRRRLPLNQCSVCAYDLTGNQSGRCPECGGKK